MANRTKFPLVVENIFSRNLPFRLPCWKKADPIKGIIRKLHTADPVLLLKEYLYSGFFELFRLDWEQTEYLVYSGILGRPVRESHFGQASGRRRET